MFLGLIRTPKCPPQETTEESYTVQKLKEAKALVKQGWCQNQNRKEKDGKIHYCVVGATHKAMMGNNEVVNDSDLDNIFKKANNLDGIPKWNDRLWRTKWSVLRGFDKAIAFAQKES